MWLSSEQQYISLGYTTVQQLQWMFALIFGDVASNYFSASSLTPTPTTPHPPYLPPFNAADQDMFYRSDYYKMLDDYIDTAPAGSNEAIAKPRYGRRSTRIAPKRAAPQGPLHGGGWGARVADPFYTDVRSILLVLWCILKVPRLFSRCGLLQPCLQTNVCRWLLPERSVYKGNHKRRSEL